MITNVERLALSQSDYETLNARGITVEQLASQIERFATGFNYLNLAGPATVGHGITRLDPITEARAEARWSAFLLEGGKVVKMVPASGAASRMFKALFEFVGGQNDKPAEGSPVAELLDNIDKFAFYDDLNRAVKTLYGLDIKTMISEGRNRAVISALINPEGLNYGNLPKGLLKFHKYADGNCHTPVEEQLAEGASTIADASGNVNVEFTVSTDHRAKFVDEIERVIPELSKRTGLHFDVRLSEQKPSTDTVAVNPDNSPLRLDGKLVFRPGGHGALIENLNDIDASVVFIKNIDNVVPDYHRETTVHYKRVLAGYLIELHDKVVDALKSLDHADRVRLDEISSMLEQVFAVKIPTGLDEQKLRDFLKAHLDRPIRVCGMVMNEGEPGGGPFIINEADGSTSLQILESTQIDMSDPKAVDMMRQATHFNPVDLVCYIRDVNGHKFNLPDYVDPETGFISSKSLHGHDLKALELPGLWNGAMSRWLTAFVEVPILTFNPVKTVNDLLRPTHQPL